VEWKNKLHQPSEYPNSFKMDFEDSRRKVLLDIFFRFNEIVQFDNGKHIESIFYTEEFQEGLVTKLLQLRELILNEIKNFELRNLLRTDRH
jgi:hypothetical protein